MRYQSIIALRQISYWCSFSTQQCDPLKSNRLKTIKINSHTSRGWHNNCYWLAPDTVSDTAYILDVPDKISYWPLSSMSMLVQDKILTIAREEHIDMVVSMGYHWSHSVMSKILLIFFRYLTSGTHNRGTWNSPSLKIGSNYISEPDIKTNMKDFIKWICPSVRKNSFALNTNIWITDRWSILCKGRL